MFKQIIEDARLSPEFCSSVLRVPQSQFKEWMDGKRPLPNFVVPELSNILGIKEKDVLSRIPARSSNGSLAPAIWFKLRDDKLTDADRELVGLIRRLGFFMGQLAQIREERPANTWRAVAQSVKDGIDQFAPPAMQGREAALRFRAAASLEHGQTGIGEMLRPRLRQSGLVVIESPTPRSALEGCCFSIGQDNFVVPCVFANTFKSTWFRRNEVLLHEVCHAIFDIESDAVSLDFRNKAQNGTEVSEARAHAFAQECLVPQSVLVHYANQYGINWNTLGAYEVAQLIAAIHVEQRTLIDAAYLNGLISEDLSSRYIEYDCSEHLRKLSPHAISTREFLEQQAKESPKWIAKNRNTTVGTRSMRLPAGYVQKVIDVFNEGGISLGKAAEMLMMDRYTFGERFGDLIKEPSTL